MMLHYLIKNKRYLSSPEISLLEAYPRQSIKE
jgi:hypothetical protein